MDAGISERRTRRGTGACDDRRPCTEEEVRANEADADVVRGFAVRDSSLSRDRWIGHEVVEGKSTFSEMNE